jgi:CheY-like chemotaxis protein
MTLESRTPPQAMETILVVEDEILVRIFIAQYLRDCGYRVIEAVGADEAIAVLKQAEIVVDVIFSDIDMPGTMDGFGLARWARANCPGAEVILTGTVPRAVDAAADLCEQNGAVPKPYEPQLVHDRIRRLLAARPRKKP